MMPDLIARCLLLVVLVAVMAMEWRFLRAADLFPATILSVQREIGQSRASDDHSSVMEVRSHVIVVRLDPSRTDGREARIGIPGRDWKTMEAGAKITVAGLRRLPFGVFWSPMVRMPAERRSPWRLILSVVAVGCAVAFAVEGWQLSSMSDP